MKKLKAESEYDQKVSNIQEQIHQKREEFRSIQKEVLEKQASTKDTHEYLVKLLEENATLK